MPAKKRNKGSTPRKSPSGSKGVSKRKVATQKKPGATTIVNNAQINSEQQLHIALNVARMGIWDWDIIKNEVTWFGDVMDLYEIDDKSVFKSIEAFMSILHPDDRSWVSGLLEDCISQNKPYSIEYRIVTRNNSIRWIAATGAVIRDESGNPIKMTGTIQDITAKKAIEQGRDESEKRFRRLQEASFGGIGIHDQGKIIDCNQGLCDLTGFSYEELQGKNGLELVAPEYRDFVIEKIRSGYDKTYDVEGIRKDGSRYMLEIRGKNIPFEGKHVRVTEFRDITDRKRAEEKILEQTTRLVAVTEDLKRKNSQLEEFTQIVSHNLRSPVGNILTLLSFYEGAESEGEKAEYIGLLKEAAGTTLVMLNELNDILKIKQSKNIEKQDLKFEKVMQQIRTMMNARITELGAEITTDFSKAPEISYPTIYLESILLNLLDNALKYYSPDRLPKISITTSTNEQGNIILEIRDNGVGINLQRYGHQVFKLRKTFHHHPESRGIGLFMIKNQIEAMGGEITVSSKENVGTSFLINFNKHQTDAS